MGLQLCCFVCHSLTTADGVAVLSAQQGKEDTILLELRINAHPLLVHFKGLNEVNP
jgi:hypothetical protein